jgi:ABC-2 type transport system permease protein
MSSITAPATRDTAQPASSVPFTATLASEWDKLVTVRSTWITLALAAILSVGTTALFAWVTGWSWSEWTEADRATFDPIEFSFIGTMFSAILFIVLGVSMVTSEYSSGMMRLTMTVTPSRGRVLLAKAIIVTMVVLVAGMLISIANFQVAQMIFGAYDLPTASLGDSDAFRAVVLGVGVTGPIYPLIGLALAFIFRSTALAITAVLGLMFAPSFFGGLLPRRWQEDVLAYLPGQAADSFAIGHLYPDNPMYLDPAVGLVVAIAWLVLFVGGAWLVLNRRDV